MKTIKSPWLVLESGPADRNYDWAWRRRTKMDGWMHTELWLCHSVTSTLFDIQDAKKIRVLLTAEQPEGNYATIKMASIENLYLENSYIKFFYVNGIEQELYPYFEEWVKQGMDQLKMNPLYVQVEVL